MTGPIRVYVNEQPVDVQPGARADAAVRAVDPLLADAVTAGTAEITDARGIVLPPDAPLAAGAILRARRPARRAGHADA